MKNIKTQFNSGQPEKDMIFGIRAVIETINAGKEIEKLLIQNDAGNSELMTELLTLAKHLQIPVSKVPVFKLDKITRKNHQGAICFISAIQYASLDNVISQTFSEGKVPLILVLDRVTDVRNFGAIARTAECAGVHAIVIPTKNAAQINSDAMKTSAGGLNFIPVCREKSLYQAVTFLQNSGLQVVACTEQTDGLLYDIDFTVPTAIVMGSEEDGISNDIIRKADCLAKIPMIGQIESLNVSVSAGVIIYEAIRQRLK